MFRKFVVHEALRAKGRAHFVRGYGVGCVGLPVAVLTTASDVADHGYGSEAFGSRFFWMTFGFNILFIGLLIGYSFGRVIWFISEKNLEQ